MSTQLKAKDFASASLSAMGENSLRRSIIFWLEAQRAGDDQSADDAVAAERARIDAETVKQLKRVLNET
jgi:hypothetical protein